MMIAQRILIFLTTFSIFFKCKTAEERVTPLACSLQPAPCSEPQPTPVPGLLSCSCSSSCYKYGECCPDAPVTIDDAAWRNLQCVHPSLSETKMGTSYLMVSSCPDEWVDNETRHFCNEPIVATKDQRHHAIPVTSVFSNITYRNIYCAVCNSEVAGLTSWQIRVSCRTRSARYKNVSEILDICNDNSFGPPPWIVDNSLEDTVLKPCNEDMKRSCSKKELNQDLIRKCLLYLAPIRTSKDGILFKNSYCAQCNGYRTGEIDQNCPQFWDLRVTHNVHDETSYTGDFGILGSRNLDLSILLSIDSRTDPNTLGRPRKCPPGYLQISWSLADIRSLDEDSNDPEVTCIRTSNTDKVSHRIGKGMNLSYDPELNCSSQLLEFNYTVDNATGQVIIEEKGQVLEKGSYEILPNSSLLVCLSIVHYERNNLESVRELLSIICSSLSLTCLFLKVVFFFQLPEARTIPNKSIVCLSVSLFIAQLLFLVGLEQTQCLYICRFLASVIHYTFLASFCWMNVLAYDIYETFASLTRNKSSKRFMMYNLYCWAAPLIPVVHSILFDTVFNVPYLRPGYGYGVCWFTNKKSLLVFFAMPLAAILVANLFFFTTTAFRIYKTTLETRIARGSSTDVRERKLLGLYVKLALIMGLTWILGFIAAFANSDVLWCLFIVSNGSQGCFIFIWFTDLRVRSHVLRMRLGLRRLRSQDTVSQRNRSSTETRNTEVHFKTKL